MKRRVLSILLGALLAGCATAYQPMGLTGGYRAAEQVGDSTYRVSFAYNGYTSPDRAEDFLLLRAADVSLQHHCLYFFSDTGVEHHFSGLSMTFACSAAKPGGAAAVIYDARLLHQSLTQKYALTDPVAMPQGTQPPAPPVKARFGMEIVTLQPSTAASRGHPGMTGVQVIARAKGSLADKRGIQAGDIIWAVDGRKFADARAFQAYVDSLPPGHRIVIQLLRGQQFVRLTGPT